MRAAVLHAPYELRIEDVPRPTVPRGHVLVRVMATAVCGTDVGIYKGGVEARLPVIQGHESTGVVAELGAGAQGLEVGDRVVLNSVVFCGRCPACFSGHLNLCAHGGLMGREMDGTFADYVAVPDVNAIKLPESISFEDGTSLIALATVFRSHAKLRITPGQSVAVIGQGAAGLLQTRVSVLSGADPVFAVARSKWKLDIAESFGAVPVAAGQVDPVRAVLDATGGVGADVVIESVGSGATLRQATDMVRPGGTVLCFGILPADLSGFDGYAMYFKELTLVGSRGMAPNDFTSAIRVVEGGRLDLAPFITHRFTLEQTKEALDLVRGAGGETLRVVVGI
jgi:2-desacetyl-2-hydroxyethyl bacteriochlorophyllide A dehydrogenase